MTALERFERSAGPELLGVAVAALVFALVLVFAGWGAP